MKKLIVYLLFLLFLSNVSAIPPIPESYMGKAYINNKIAPTGANVTVVSTSGESWSTVVVTNGDWSLDIIFDDSDTSVDEGASDNEALTWYVNGVVAFQPVAEGDKAMSGGNNLDFIISLGSTPKLTCSDGIKNQGETDVDCGGPCKPCDGAVTTSLPAKDTTTSLRSTNTTTTVKSFVNNLLSRIKPKTTTSLKTEKQAQTTTIDQTGATCYDGIRNQGEESVDCGGPCKPCKTSLVPWWLILGTVIVLVFIGTILVVGIVLYVKRPWK